MKEFITLFLLLITAESSAQFNGRDFSIGFNAVYTTSARIYLQPYASDEAIRNNSFPVEDILNPSTEIRYALSESIILGLGTEYMNVTEEGSNLIVFTAGGTRAIRVQEGFKFIPVEFTAYYLFPFSTEKFKFLMGGGAGYYYGSHVRKIGDAEVNTIERKFAYGIHVNISMDYLFRPNISIRTEMKFRDPQFTVKSSYNKREIEYEGTTIRFLQESFDSKINIDGVTFLIGAAFHF
ncbi:MAG: hypothetical protein EHM47_16985 [Ignavibacteriales bacterium]|nr:MAG: hypothetical protein EHM47_16985 [Ignavibacteriales bacterium]